MTRKPRVILEFKYVGRGLLYWRMESVHSHEWVVELVDGCYSRSNGINTTMRAYISRREGVKYAITRTLIVENTLPVNFKIILT